MSQHCDMCGAEMLPPAPETVPYQCGIPNVFLLEVSVSRCSACDEYEVTIPDVEGLHREIALSVAKGDTLEVQSIRFLRKYLGWAQKDMAAHFEVDPATVSRWENGHQPMSKPYQKLLRLLAERGPLKDDYARDCASHEQAKRFRLAGGDEGWQPAAE